ncbi:MAG: T9SS C-terminal target domain-containing protein, partial [Calditrichaeota bacterium]
VLTIAGIADIAKTPNLIAQPIDIAFKHVHWPSQTAASWTLDDGEGSVIHDVSGNANDGQAYNGVEWSGGYTGNGLIFDGIDDFIKIPSSTSLDIAGNAVSISLWTKLALLPNELPGAFGPIYDSDSDNYVIYEDKNNNELRFKVTTTSAAERPGIPAVQLRKNEWLHIVGVYDGNHAKIYLNGQLQDSHALSGNVKPGQIAILGQSAGSYFKGCIDNIQIYSQALLLEEIQMLYTGQKQTTAIADKVEHPTGFDLVQNYPNPFNPTTTISYSIPAAGMVRLNLYDILGREVKSIVNHHQPAGSYMVIIDASDLPAGMYCYRLASGPFVAVKKLILAK